MSNFSCCVTLTRRGDVLWAGMLRSHMRRWQSAVSASHLAGEVAVAASHSRLLGAALQCWAGAAQRRRCMRRLVMRCMARTEKSLLLLSMQLWVAAAAAAADRRRQAGQASDARLLRRMVKVSHTLGGFNGAVVMGHVCTGRWDDGCSAGRWMQPGGLTGWTVLSRLVHHLQLFRTHPWQQPPPEY
jgi:hypothetical protein